MIQLPPIDQSKNQRRLPLPSIHTLLQPNNDPNHIPQFEAQFAKLELLNRQDMSELQIRQIRSPQWTFEGQVRNGVPHGKGKITYNDSLPWILFEGECVNGKICGRGTLWYRNGCVYIGQFENNKLHGVGNYTHPAGKIYAGEFRDNHPEGQGILILPERKGSLKGIFTIKTNHMVGTGNFYCKAGCVHKAIFKNGKLKMLSLIKDLPIETDGDETEDEEPAFEPANNRKRPRDDKAIDPNPKPKKMFRSCLKMSDRLKLFKNGRAINGFLDNVVKFLRDTTDWPSTKLYTNSEIINLLTQKYLLSKPISYSTYCKAKSATKI